MILSLALLAIAVAIQPARSQVLVSAYSGWDATLAPASLTNSVDAFNSGATVNNNIAINGTANVFTLNFVDGPNVGHATFTVSDDYGTVGVLRQLTNGLQGSANTAEDLTITLSGCQCGVSSAETGCARAARKLNFRATTAWPGRLLSKISCKRCGHHAGGD